MEEECLVQNYVIHVGSGNFPSLTWLILHVILEFETKVLGLIKVFLNKLEKIKSKYNCRLRVEDKHKMGKERKERMKNIHHRMHPLCTKTQ